MHQKSIEDYIREMMALRERSTVSVLNVGSEPAEVITTGIEKPQRQEETSITEEESRRQHSDAEPKSDIFQIEKETAKVYETVRDIPVVPQNTRSDTVAGDTEKKQQTPQKDNVMGMGRLIVNVTTGQGLFPVEGAAVIISGGGNDDEITTVITDMSGKTPLMYLPAPPREKSIIPSEKGDGDGTRAQYNITVTAPGYVTTVIEGVSVFDGVTSIQKADIMTLSASGGNSAPRIVDERTTYKL